MLGLKIQLGAAAGDVYDRRAMKHRFDRLAANFVGRNVDRQAANSGRRAERQRDSREKRVHPGSFHQRSKREEGETCGQLVHPLAPL